MFPRILLTLASALLVAGCYSSDIAGSCAFEDEYRNTCTPAPDEDPGRAVPEPVKEPVVQPPVKPRDPLF